MKAGSLASLSSNSQGSVKGLMGHGWEGTGRALRASMSTGATLGYLWLVSVCLPHLYSEMGTRFSPLRPPQLSWTLATLSLGEVTLLLIIFLCRKRGGD